MIHSAYKTMLNEIGRTKPIPKRQEQELFREYETCGNYRKQQIKKLIINANMRLVLKVALAYRNISGVNIADLVSEGKLGLLKAFNEFEWRKGFKFISYAIWDIRAKMSKHLKETDLIKIPTKKLTDCRSLKKQVNNITDLDPEMYYIYELTSSQISLDYIPPDCTASIADLIKDDNIENVEKKHLSNVLRTNMLNKLKAVLDEIEFTVLKGFFGFENEQDMSLRDLGDKLHKSHERIRQIRDSGIRKLRKSNQMEDFRNFFLELSKIEA